MTPEQQRIAIAGACGWHSLKTTGCDGLPDLLWGSLVASGQTGLPTELVPDYLNDLNAMHEALNVFNNRAPLPRTGWWARYFGNLETVINIPHSFMPQFDIEAAIKLSNATAKQKAEAFLKTLDIWTE
jgi:hypothetical protein